jgi:hypothetical protein
VCVDVGMGLESWLGVSVYVVKKETSGCCVNTEKMG